jgi:hypothetical protein
MGVSVPQMPRTTNLRVLFFVFVCYCFAMSTIFQAFFTSFLVAPGYEKEIATFDELMHSELMYGEFGQYERLLRIESVDFIEDMKLKKFDCPRTMLCLKHLFTEGDITTLATRNDAEYAYPFKENAVGGKNSLCSVEENSYLFYSVMSLKKGFPLLDRFNVVMRRCMESGLVDKYWSEFNFVRQIKDDSEIEENNCAECDGEYFVFSLSHLKAAFVVLGLGYLLCVFVFIVELFWK